MIQEHVLQKIKKLDIKIHRLVNQTFAGEYKSAFKGSGLEFSNVRAYEIGDDIRRIDWQVSSRNQNWYIKEYQEERQIRLISVLDVSASQNIGFEGLTKLEIGREIAALFAFLAQKNNDLSGLLTLTNEIEHYMEPKNGKAHFFKLLSHLFDYDPIHTGTNLKKGFEFLLKTQKKRSTIIIISDFLDENWEKELMMLKKIHDIKLIRLYHPQEFNFSFPGFAPLEDAENGNIFWYNPFQKNIILNPEEKIQEIQKQGIAVLSLDITKDYFPFLEKFLKK